jgi:hypothetical protein
MSAMNPKPAVVALCATALLLGACSLLTDFSLEGVPCDPANAPPCLEGFGCVDGKCVAGADAGFDCALCPSGECIPGAAQCLPPSCEQRVCAAGYQCEVSNGVPTCRSVPEGKLGQFCFSDNDCRRSGDPAHQNRVCMRGAVQLQTTGQLRSGVCVEPCGAEDTCTTEGAECRPFTLGADAGTTRVCLPRTAMTACTSNPVCQKGQLVCTVFDHPETGPITACDQPLNQGAAPGLPCVRTTGDGGTLCANGLCIPQVTVADQPAFCGELCDEGTCALGTCQQVEFGVENVIRYVPMCVVEPTRCTACDADPARCRPDAPRCTAFGGALVCLGACTPGASGPLQCPEGHECQALGAGTASFCVPLQGMACP